MNNRAIIEAEQAREARAKQRKRRRQAVSMSVGHLRKELGRTPTEKEVLSLACALEGQPWV